MPYDDMNPSAILESFRSYLRHFSADAFLESTEPYLRLARDTKGQPVLYRQLSEELVRIAVSKGADADAVRSELNHMTEKLGRENTDVVLRKIHAAERNAKIGPYKGMVQVLPIMCGIGKSTAIRLRIREVLLSKKPDGMLVVTDNTERLWDYVKPDVSSDLDKDLAQFFQDHENEYCVLESRTLEQARSKAHDCKVLLMTTQRYVHLTDEELTEYSYWGDDQCPRSLIIVDEEPFLYELTSIGTTQINNIKSALHDGIPARAIARGEKAAAKRFWQDYANRLLLRIEMYDRDVTGSASSMKVEYLRRIFNADDAREKAFLETVRKYKSYINTYDGSDDDYEDMVALIEAALLVFHEPFLFTTRDDAMNSKTSYTVLRDNTSRFERPNARVLILDGTADISPVYKIRPDLFHMMNVRDCNRHLDNLHIHVYNTSAGRTTLSKYSMKNKDQLVEEIWRNAIAMPGKKPPVAFSYKFMRDAFIRKFKTGEKTNFEHLGNIRGKNKFRDVDRIVQLGLNHTEPLKYVLYRTKGEHSFEEELLDANMEANGYLLQKERLMKEVNNPNSPTNIIINQLMLCDVEQNMFRGQIRNLIGGEYHFAVYFNESKYGYLRNQMERRYARDLGAHIEEGAFSFLFRFTAYIMQRGDNKSGNRLIKAMLSFKPGVVYKKEDIKRVGELTDTQYDSAIRSDVVKEIMEMARCSRGKYDNRGIDNYRELCALMNISESSTNEE